MQVTISKSFSFGKQRNVELTVEKCGCRLFNRIDLLDFTKEQ